MDSFVRTIVYKLALYIGNDQDQSHKGLITASQSSLRRDETGLVGLEYVNQDVNDSIDEIAAEDKDAQLHTASVKNDAASQNSLRRDETAQPSVVELEFVNDSIDKIAAGDKDAQLHTASVKNDAASQNSLRLHETPQRDLLELKFVNDAVDEIPRDDAVAQLHTAPVEQDVVSQRTLRYCGTGQPDGSLFVCFPPFDSPPDHEDNVDLVELINDIEKTLNKFIKAREKTKLRPIFIDGASVSYM